MNKTVLLLLAIVAASLAEVRMDSYIGDNMVIQRDQSFCLRGETSQGKKGLTAAISLAGAVAYAVTNDTGSFAACFGPRALNNTPSEMIIAVQGESAISFSNILFGDVHLCSGQSNMQFSVISSFNATEEIAKANFPNLRIYTVVQNVSDLPLRYLGHYQRQGWNPATPQSVGGPAYQYASAVCYFYGRNIFESLGGKVPIGILATSYGGTIVEAWSSPDALAKCSHSETNYSDAPNPNRPSVLWNSMVVPLLNMRFRSAIWYQGESNAGQYKEYMCKFPAMISDWRSKFAFGNFPFYFVQLAAYYPGGESWSWMRLAQTAALSLPNSGMATAMDLGDPQSPMHPIHPRDKQHVGLRLALIAQNKIYGQNTVFLGPSIVNVVSNQQGTQFTATLNIAPNTPGNMYFANTVGCNSCCGTSYGFELVGEKGKVFNATRVAFVDKQASIRVDGSVTEKIAFIRYAFNPYPQCAFYNIVGLPATPFIVQAK